MGAQSTVRRTLGRAGGKARRLIPLAAALLLAALVAIPASNVALAQAPPGDGIVLVNADRDFVERKGGGEFVARPVFDREIANLFYAVPGRRHRRLDQRHVPRQGREKKRNEGWEYSWEYPGLDEHPDLDKDRAYLLVMLAEAEDGRGATSTPSYPSTSRGASGTRFCPPSARRVGAKAFAGWVIEGVHGTLCGVVERGVRRGRSTTAGEGSGR